MSFNFIKTFKGEFLSSSVLVAGIYFCYFLIFNPFTQSNSYIAAQYALAIITIIFLVLFRFKTLVIAQDKVFWPLVCIIPIFVYVPNNIIFLSNGRYIQYFGLLALLPFSIGAILYWLKKVPTKYIRYPFISLFIFYFMPAWHNVIKLNIEDSFYQQFLFIFLIMICIVSLKRFHKVINIASICIILFQTAEISVETYKSQIALKGIENKAKIPSYLENKKLVKKPNIYVLIYDGYVGPKLMNFYGIDNSAQFSYLADKGFTLYNDKITTGAPSLSSMSKLLSLQNQPPLNKRAYFSGFGALDLFLKREGYSRRYFNGGYFLMGFEKLQHNNEVITPYNGVVRENELFASVLAGEFKFNIDVAKTNYYERWLEVKELFLRGGQSPKFSFTHTYKPGHSQNSGRCLDDESELYRQRLQEANLEMKNDLEYITKSDPSAIILLIGDHGAYLTADCNGGNKDKSYPMTGQLFADVYGVFVAIKWPDNNYQNFDHFKYMQGSMFSVLAYLLEDPSILEHQIQSPVCHLGMCVNDSGEIVSEDSKGDNIWNIISNNPNAN